MNSGGAPRDTIAELERTASETLDRFALDPDRLDRRYGPGKWSVRELLHHLADAETVLFDRIRRAISEPGSVVWAFDQDRWAESLDYADRPLDLSRDLYISTREGVLYYARRHYATSDSVRFVHSETGLRTLKDEFDKVAHHNATHLTHIDLALG
jgi:hypothetical protein